MLDAFAANIGCNGEKNGTRVQLSYTDDPYTNLKNGDKGSVNFVDDYGTIHVNWDNGSTLGLVPNHDKWILIQ